MLATFVNACHRRWRGKTSDRPGAQRDGWSNGYAGTVHFLQGHGRSGNAKVFGRHGTGRPKRPAASSYAVLSRLSALPPPGRIMNTRRPCRLRELRWAWYQALSTTWRPRNHPGVWDGGRSICPIVLNCPRAMRCWRHVRGSRPQKAEQTSDPARRATPAMIERGIGSSRVWLPCRGRPDIPLPVWL